jgi:hypothetical protein
MHQFSVLIFFKFFEVSLTMGRKGKKKLQQDSGRLGWKLGERGETKVISDSVLSLRSHTRVASSFLPLFVDVRDGWMDLALA